MGWEALGAKKGFVFCSQIQASSTQTFSAVTSSGAKEVFASGCHWLELVHDVWLDVVRGTKPSMYTIE